MVILDTNVLSEVMRQTPDSKVVDWLDNQPRTSVWITSITILEIRFGLEILPMGKRRATLMKSFSTLLTELIGNRVAEFDAAAAQHAAVLMALRHKAGRTVDLRDTLIAGIALASHATLATRNTLHFEGLGLAVPIINPWGG